MPFIAMIVAMVVAAGCASSGDSAPSASTHLSSTAGKEFSGRPACEVGFDVTPANGKLSENAVLAKADMGQTVTIHLTMHVQSHTHILIKDLSLLIEPSIVGTNPFPALRDIPLHHGSVVNGLPMKATFTINTPGRYVVLVYAVSTSSCPDQERGLVTSAAAVGDVGSLTGSRSAQNPSSDSAPA